MLPNKFSNKLLNLLLC